MSTPIRGIIFDYGGIISLPQVKDELYPFLEKRFGISEKTVLEGYRKHRWAADADLLNMEQLYRKILEDNGVTRCLIPALLSYLADADFRSWAHRNPETPEWIRELKGQGYKIGILTNMPTSFLPYFDAVAHDVRAMADAEVVSGIHHLVKPDREIFDLMSRTIGIPAHELLFFDDLERNVQGAEEAGFHASLFTGVAAARQVLAAGYELLGKDLNA